jgi:pectin methylesterase-like acyl-CoA thioesterase
MAFLITTTGNLPKVTLGDLGGRSFTHPTTNFDLEKNFTIDEIRDSSDIFTSITSGYITATFKGVNITSNIDIDSVRSDDDRLYTKNKLLVKINPGVGEFSSIKSAVDSITNNTTTNRYVVSVGPGLFIEDTITMKPHISLVGSGISTVIQVNATSKNVINGADFSSISDFLLQGATDSGKSAIFYTSSTTGSWFRVSNITFGNNDTLVISSGQGTGYCTTLCRGLNYGLPYTFSTGFKATNSGSGVGRVVVQDSTTNGGISSPYPTLFAITDAPKCEMIMNSVQAKTGNISPIGVCIQAQNGGILRLSSVNINGWGTGIYMPNIGQATNISAVSINALNNSKDLSVEHPSAGGKIAGLDDITKYTINSSSSVYLVGKDEHLIIVAKKGGDYTSVKAAMDSITNNSSSNRYLVHLNPGIYIEDTIILKSFVTLKGYDPKTCIIQVNSTSKDVIIGSPDSVIRNLGIEGASDNGKSAIVYNGGSSTAFLRIFDCRFLFCNTILNQNSTNGESIVRMFSCDIEPTCNFSTAFNITDSGVYRTTSYVDNIFWVSILASSTNFMNFVKVSGSMTIFNGTGINSTISDGIILGSCYHALNSGTINISSSNIKGFQKGIFSENIGGGPLFNIHGMDFLNCTLNIDIENVNTSGSMIGYSEYEKTFISPSSFFIKNKDLKEIIVSKHGGDFSSIASAVNSILDSSDTNRYVIRVGPGEFIEPLIDLSSKQYISVVGNTIQSSIIKPDSPTHHIFSIGIYNELSFLWLEGSGPGYAAIACLDSGDYSQAHKVTFNNCDIGLLVTSATVDTKFYGEYMDYNGQYSYGSKIIATNGFISYSNLENYYNLPTVSSGTSSLPCGTYISGVGARVNLLASGNEGIGEGIGIYLQDGAVVDVSSTEILNFEYGIQVANIGTYSTVNVNSTSVKSTFRDISIDHPSAIGGYQGTADIDLVSLSSSFFTLNLQDNGGGIFLSKSLNIRFSDGTTTDISTNIIKTSTTGLMLGGMMTDVGGLNVSISAGFGYLESFPIAGVLKRYDWPISTITLTSNTNNYIYFNYNGLLIISSSIPNTFNNILFGRVVTNSSGIEFIEDSGLHADHTSNRLIDFNKNALGSVYSSGSIVSENITPFHLNATPGSYYFGENNLVASGGSDIPFITYYKDGSGGFIRGTSSVVDNTQYDNGSGTLTPISIGYYVKHTLYVVGDSGREKYFFIYGQEQFSALTLAEQGNIPSPPNFFIDAVVLISSIIVKQGSSNIIEIQDLRPIVGFRAPTVSATSYHSNLLGLLQDDHPQYLLVSGVRSMSGDLIMGSNSISGVNLINGVNINTHASRHLPNGSDPLTTGVPSTIGTVNFTGITNALSRQDHVHAHGSQTDGTLHAIVTTSVNGFMSSFDKGKLNDIATASIVYNNQSNIFGTFSQVFKSSNISIRNPSDTFGYTFIGSGITASYNLVIPLLTSDDTIITSSAIQTLSNKISYDGLVITPNTGVVTTGTWNGTGISATFGGTDQTSYVVGDILFANTTTSLSRLSSVASGSYLRSGGVGVAPLWSLLSLPNTSTTGDLLFSSATNSVSNLADVASGNVLLSGGVGIAPLYGKVGLTTHVSGVLPSLNGGTGVANTGLITLGGNFTTTGAFNTTFNQQFSGIITLPNATSTLSTLSLPESLINKTGYNGLVITANTGVVTTGTWNAGVILGQYGGTGVANTGLTITLGGNLVTTGTFSTIFAQQGNFIYTLPNATSTLATLSLAESLINKTGYNGLVITANTGVITTGTWNGGIILGQYGGTGVANTGLTITLGGNLITTGTFNTTLAQQFSGVITLPNATSTLATTTLVESLTNKTGYNGLVITSNTGVVTTGTWNAGIITGQYGGTGVANTGLSITLGGNLITTGTFNTTFAQQFSGVITLPNATSTLATLSLSESLLNKTGYNGLVITANTGVVTTGTWNAGIILGQYGGTGVANTGLTITLGGNLTTTGAFNTIFTQQGSFTYTLPNATSTLATVSLSEFLINKTGYNGLVITANTGVVTTGTWNGTVISALFGGTGQTSYVVGDILFANTTTSLSILSDVAVGSYLRSGGVGVAPLWSSLTLPNSANTGDLLYASAPNTISTLSDITTGNVLLSGGVGVPSYGKVGLTTHVSGILPSLNGGTGVANTGLITLSGNLTTTGAFNTTFNQQSNGVITLPNATSTIATLSLFESLTNKTGYNGLVITPNSGIVTTGTWNGSLISGQYGGTGVANTGLTITLGGNLITTGAFNTTFNQQFSGVVTLPNATSTIATLALAESLLNKTGYNGLVVTPNIGFITTGTWNATIISGQYGGTGVANTGLTITLGGNLATTGAFNTTLSQQFSGIITLPNATSTLATTTLAESLINKTGYNGLVITANTGVITTGTWNGTVIGANYGGTGQTLYSIGDILYADTTTSLAKLSDVVTGSYLRSGGIGVAPSWSLLTLPNTSTIGDLLVSSGTNSVSNLSDIATGNVLISGGVGVVPSYGKVGLTTHVSGILPSLNGGTGVANIGLITLGGNLTTTGTFNTTLAQQFSGVITLPNATSTLATTTLSESLLNKIGYNGLVITANTGVVTTGTWNAGIILGQYGGTGVANTGLTITLGGNLITTGTFNTTLAQQFSGIITLPNATSSLATLSLSETLSNKTLNNTNSLTIKDNSLTVQDHTDVTKQMLLQLSGITTSTTRTLTVPDINGVILVRDGEFKSTVSTTDATLTSAQSISTTTDKSYIVESRIISRKTSGTGSGAVGDTNTYIRTVGVKNIGGVVTLGTIQTTYTSEDIASHNVTFNITGNNIIVTINGSANNNVSWSIISEIIIL